MNYEMPSNDDYIDFSNVYELRIERASTNTVAGRLNGPQVEKV